MQYNAKEVPCEGRAPLWVYGALCLGFGCFFAMCPFSALGTEAMYRCAMGWREILCAHTVFMISAAVCFFSKGMTAPGKDGMVRGALIGGIAAILGVLLLHCGGPALSGWILALGYGGLLGCSMAFLGGCWFRMFFAVRYTCGRLACITVFAGSLLCTVPFTWSSSFVGIDGVGPLILTVGVVVLSCVLVPVVEGHIEMSCSRGEANAGETGNFGLTSYARVVLLAFGASWGLLYNVPVDMGYGSGQDESFRWAITVISCGILPVVLGVFVREIDIDAMRFGLMLRWVIVLMGVLWAFAPTLVGVAPIMAGIAFIMVFWIQLTVLFVFVMEVCLEAELPFSVVLPRYFGMFVCGVCMGAALFLLIRSQLGDAKSSLALVSAFGATISLVVMPFLPSRGSRAEVFTLDCLPEDVDGALRNERAREEFVEACGFTPREAEVFELLMLGHGREEVAATLQISPWTVKNHIGAVLSKAGVRSTKELMGLVYGREEGREGRRP